MDLITIKSSRGGAQAESQADCKRIHRGRSATLAILGSHMLHACIHGHAYRRAYRHMYRDVWVSGEVVGLSTDECRGCSAATYSKPKGQGHNMAVHVCVCEASLRRSAVWCRHAI